jgi:hypothetical protein
MIQLLMMHCLLAFFIEDIKRLQTKRVEAISNPEQYGFLT